MSCKRVALFTNSSWNVKNFRSELLEALQNQGYAIDLIVPDQYVDLSRFGNVHIVPMHPTSMNPAKEMRVLRALHGLLASISPDILLTFTIKPNFYGSLAARRLKIPVVCNITGLGEAFGGDWRKSLIAKAIYRHGIGKADCVLVQNRDDQKFLSENRLVADTSVRLIPGSGVNLEKYRPESCAGAGINNRTPRFLFVGRLRADKGFFEFAQAADRLLAEGLEAEFHVVGKIESTRSQAVGRGFLQDMIDRNVLQYRGFVEDVRKEICDADCVVLPSYREGLPRSLLEAAALGKPTIATDVPGCRDVVRHEATGLLCTPRDSVALANTIRKFCAMSRQQRACMGALGRQLVEEKFDVSLVIREYLEVIGNLIGGPSLITRSDRLFVNNV